jgi:lipoate-protein ligase A
VEAIPRHRELTPWSVIRSVGDAGDFHAADPEPRRTATFHEVEVPTYVLGSSQPESTVDRRVADRLGVRVVRRRSGGGGVLLVPGEFVWLDLVVPAEDPLWSPDVAATMWWAGDLWRGVLGGLGIDAVRHDGRLVTTEWSPVVCFAGLGAGELVAAERPGSKLVGISQRRTRHWARLQTMCHLRWRPELMAALTASPRPPAAAIAGCAEVVDVDASRLVAALTTALLS